MATLHIIGNVVPKNPGYFVFTTYIKGGIMENSQHNN